MTGWLRNVFGADKANDAAQAASQTQATAATEAANLSLESQREALAWLQQRESVPMGIRDDALRGLADFYEVPGAPEQRKTQEQLIQEAMSSPLYGAIMGTQRAGEQAILRNRSATGGLRSGNTQGALTDYGQQTANRALLDSFGEAQATNNADIARADALRGLHLTGLSGLAGLEGNDNAIASLTANMGATQGQGVLNAANARSGGIVAGAQSQNDALNNVFNTLLGFGQMAAGAGWFSDIRLKDNIHYLGKRGGFDFYGWTWNEIAREKFSLEGNAQGVIAHHIFEEYPDVIGEHEGYLTVHYDMLMEAA